jgi:hypothetical protein
MTVRFRVRFLDRSANIVCEMTSSARSVEHVTEMLKAIDWPPAAGLRILDRDGHQVDFLRNSAVETGSSKIRPPAPHPSS